MTPDRAFISSIGFFIWVAENIAAWNPMAGIQDVDSMIVIIL